jgi:hypothetical protein
VPIVLNDTEVYLDFHIYAILEFDLLIGHPIEKLFKEKPSHGGVNENLGIAASATSIPCPEIPMAEHLANHNPFEEAKFISLFVSSMLPCETEHLLPTSLKPKPCPSGHPNVILDGGRDSTLIMHNGSFDKENFCAMGCLKHQL